MPVLGLSSSPNLLKFTNLATLKLREFGSGLNCHIVPQRKANGCQEVCYQEGSICGGPPPGACWESQSKGKCPPDLRIKSPRRAVVLKGWNAPMAPTRVFCPLLQFLAVSSWCKPMIYLWYCIQDNPGLIAGLSKPKQDPDMINW